MNYHLNSIPERTSKPRVEGFTMVMDKGLSLREVEDMIETSGPYIDIVKLGWATSFVYPKLEEKLAMYKEAGIPFPETSPITKAKRSVPISIKSNRSPPTDVAGIFLAYTTYLSWSEWGNAWGIKLC